MEAATKAYPLCGAKTRSGKPCAKYRMSGKRRCRLCTSSDLMEPFDPISKRHFSAGDLSSLTC